MPHPAEPDRAEPDPAGDPSAADALSVVVERTGGFAGLSRRWSVTTRPDDTTWTALLDACDWGEDGERRLAGEPAGADRFCWTVTARTAAAEHSAALAEHEVDGPWRALIDAVRSASEQ